MKEENNGNGCDRRYADFIERIEIDSLWSGKRHVVWNLDKRVNILSGINGVRKGVSS